MLAWGPGPAIAQCKKLFTNPREHARRVVRVKPFAAMQAAWKAEHVDTTRRLYASHVADVLDAAISLAKASGNKCLMFMM